MMMEQQSLFDYEPRAGSRFDIPSVVADKGALLPAEYNPVDAVTPGTIVAHMVEDNGRLQAIEYRRDEGSAWRAGFWSYKPEGFSEWIPVRNPTIRRRLDRRLHPRDESVDTC